MFENEDQELVRKVLTGKKNAFEALMKKYNSKIFNFILRMVRDENVAIELTQDFFIKLFNVLNKYNFEYKFSTWIYRICYNLVIDYIRKNKINIDSLDSDVTPKQLFKGEGCTFVDGFNQMAKDETHFHLWRIVNAIPIKYRELILMRYIQELKYEEISEITQLPVGTVKNRIFKAKELLKVELEKDGLLKL